ncbi:MAG: hypothetical protein QOI59_6671 [Gammaproteobacteria bacterium]|jgi:hypothetical protein|nr:hypothetical protein [Gammaproteobacteria bacterium]
MEFKEEVVAAVNCGRGTETVVRNLYPLVTSCLPSTEAANGPEPSSIEADRAGPDAPISVWWDHLPGVDLR